MVFREVIIKKMNVRIIDIIREIIKVVMKKMIKRSKAILRR